MNVEFLRGRLSDEQAILKRLYEERPKAGIGAEGSYDIQIDSSKREIKKLEDELAQHVQEIVDVKTESSLIFEPDSPAPKVERTIGNFPTTIPYFIERTEIIKEFKEAYTGYSFISISGMGGIGKTQFAAKGIEEFSIPKEKIVWFECEPASTLDAVIDYSGFGEILKGESKRDKEKVLAFIDKINENQLVLFLEDYHYVSKKSLLGDLLKECNTKLKLGKVIVISRDDMVDFTIQPKQISLKGLEDKEELLGYISNLKKFLKIEDNYSDDELLELCTKLEGHPFAIYLAFILLAKQIGIHEIIDEIIAIDDDGNVSERLLNAIFNREDATDEEKSFIKEFSALRGKVFQIDVENIFSKEGVRIARKLKDKNLVVIQDGKISLHPLVREFCYKRLKSKQVVHQKISKYYITKRKEKLVAELEDRIFYHLTRGQESEKINDTIATLGRQFIQQGFTGILQNMIENQEATFEELPEVTNILYGEILEIKGEWSKSLAFYEKAFQSTTLKIRIEGLIKKGEVLYGMGERETAGALFNRAINEIEVDNGSFIKEKALALNNLGQYKFDLGKSKEALELFEKSLNIREEIGDKSGIAYSYNNIGRLKSTLGNKAEALELFEKSLKIKEEIGDKSGIATSCNNIGALKSEFGEMEEALELYESCLKIQEEIGEKSGIARSYVNIGVLKSSLGKKEIALALYESGLSILEEIGDKSGIATCYINIGILKSGLGKKEEALKLYEKSLMIREGIGGKSGIASSYNSIGSLKSGLGKNEEALDLYERSLKIRVEIGDKSGIAASYNSIGRLKFRLGKNEEALDLYERSLKILEEIGEKSGIATSYNNIGGVKDELGKKEEALELFERSLKIREEIGDKSGIATSYNNIGGVKSSLGKKKEALALCKKSLKILEEIGEKSGIANSYNNIGVLKSELGKKEEALELFEKSLKILEEIGEKSGIVRSCSNIGVILMEKGRVDIACSFFLKSFLLCKHMSLPEQRTIKSRLIDLRKENKNKFKEIAQSAYETLSEDLKVGYNENEVYGMPLKSQTKIGRNEKCPCGSGKKYKHCHGK